MPSSHHPVSAAGRGFLVSNRVRGLKLVRFLVLALHQFLPTERVLTGVNDI
jgi:hypothetical protein